MKPRNVPPNPLEADLAQICLTADLPLELRQQHLSLLRAQAPQHADELDRLLLERHDQVCRGLREAQHKQAELKTMLDTVLGTPWHTAIFVGPHVSSAAPRACVLHGGARHVVNLAPEVKLESLRPGDQVFLNHELNVLTGVSPEGLPRCGELALFDRFDGHGHLVVKWRDDELVLQPAHPLIGAVLQPGDLVRFDRACWMAFEKVANPEGREFLLEDVPAMTRDQIGGQETNYELLFTAISAPLVDPAKARRYFRGKRGITAILIGPPGCGKTLMSRVLASEIEQLTGRKCRIAVVKPAAWESPYVGMTQKAIRDTFKMLRDATRDGTIAILFIDELETVSRTRGHFSNIHGDRHLGALLAEIDGFQGRENVAIIAATNRKDLIDPAMLSRFVTEVRVGRPDPRAAQAIFKTHLPASLPFSPNGELAGRTHEALIEQAVSRLYAPNADNALCRLRFRDGKERTIAARELVSGRFIAQVCERAIDRSFARDVRGGEPGLTAADMEAALEEGLDRLRTTLTPRNAHEHLADLPQDLDVVSVEPLTRKVTNRRRYVTLEAI